MLFWKRKKFDEAEIKQIFEEYLEVLKTTMGKYLSRQMRRALSKNKGWGSLSPSQKREQIQEIKQKGLNNWLDEHTEEVFEQISSFVSDSGLLKEDLKKALKEFKKKWNIK